METISEVQRLFDEAVDLRHRNEQLIAENARLRRELSCAKRQIAQLKYLLRRTI